MDALSTFLQALKKSGRARGELLGLLHVLIAHRIVRADGTQVAAGLTWRELALLLKKVRWDPDSVAEVGVDPETLAPRDRFRYWYQAIAQAKVDSPAAREAGERFAKILPKLGYQVAPPPT